MGVHGGCDRGTTRQARLGQDAMDVVLDRRDRDAEPGRDLFVGQPRRHQLGDFGFPARQPSKAPQKGRLKNDDRMSEVLGRRQIDQHAPREIQRGRKLEKVGLEQGTTALLTSSRDDCAESLQR